LGTGAVSGSAVTDPSAWVAPTSGNYRIEFTSNTTYQIYDGATALLATPGTYTSGQPIELQKTTSPPADFGASVTVTGVPQTGDTFMIAHSPNSGSGAISGSTVTNPAAWVAPTSGSYSVQFSVSGGVTTYQIYDGATPLLATPGAYTSGQSIELQKTTAPAVDFGASVTVTGTPANGDTFVVSPSTSQSLFATLANLIHAVEGTGTTAADVARYQTDVKNAGIDLENARVNIVQADAALGGRMNEVDTVSSINSSVDLQYQQTLSNLQDLDMVKALTDLTSKQTQLDAAQKSFVSTSKLSLFNYL
jgi:flagellar hook-associated protein 3 FlgL